MKPRMRTIQQAAALIRDGDPDTAFTETALRRLVVTGALPCVRIGKKYLLDLDTLEAYLSGSIPLTASDSEIRRIMYE